MRSPEKILMVTVGSLLLAAILLFALSGALSNALLRTVGLYVFGIAVILAFLLLILLCMMLLYERIKKPQSGADD